MTLDRLDTVFLALADPTRRALLARLAQGEATVAELARAAAAARGGPLSQPAVSKHLKVLEQAGFVVASRDGQRRPRRLDPAPLAEVEAWIARHREAWEASFVRLDALLAELRPPEEP